MAGANDKAFQRPGYLSGPVPCKGLTENQQKHPNGPSISSLSCSPHKFKSRHWDKSLSGWLFLPALNPDLSVEPVRLQGVQISAQRILCVGRSQIPADNRVALCQPDRLMFFLSGTTGPWSWINIPKKDSAPTFSVTAAGLVPVPSVVHYGQNRSTAAAAVEENRPLSSATSGERTIGGECKGL